MNIKVLSILTALGAPILNAQSLPTQQEFANPANDCRIKTWWFFGYEETTNEGITADVEALKDAGFGGVVYYDQNHRPNKKLPNGEGNTPLPQSGKEPEDGFSPEWWSHLKWAAREAHRVGLTFELNISNGYVAGGRWIDPHHAMQRVASSEITVNGGKEVSIELPPVDGPQGYSEDIAVLAFPIKEEKDVYRHFTARYAPKGKGRNGAMQTPDSVLERETLDTMQEGPRPFGGSLFQTRKPIGMLQSSQDSVNWQDVIELQPMYSSLGVYSWRSSAFPAVRARYMRVKYYNEERLRSWSVGPEALLDRWEERAALQSDFTEADPTPNYDSQEIIHSDQIIDLTNYCQKGHLNWKAPKGNWRIVRFASVLTGAKSKHGRENLLGYECDKLSVEAAELHWNSYMRVILDSLRADGIDWVEGVCMDSHEGGSQNWTPKMFEEFSNRRGYDLKTYLPMLAGYLVDSKEKTQEVLYDLRCTVNDCMRENYFGTFERLAQQNHLTFTAQAIGNGLSITGDAISVKQVVDKPQTEFWAYQQTGAYDLKDGTSACHLYGIPIHSTEAFTDANYQHSISALKRVGDIAIANGSQEMVICATPHIPQVHFTEPYISGRVYAINRTHPEWKQMKPMWLSLAREVLMMRQGKPAPDVLVYLGDDLPTKILTNRLPHGLHGLDWDVCTEDALQHRLSPMSDGRLTTPDSITYGALLIADQALITPASKQILKHWEESGVKILKNGFSVNRPMKILQGDESVVHTHRSIDGRDLFFLANITEAGQDIAFQLKESSGIQIYRCENADIESLENRQNGKYAIHLRGGEAVIIVMLQ